MWVGKFFVSLRSDSLNIKDFWVVIWMQDFDVENQENTTQKTAQKTAQKISAKQEEILSYLKKKDLFREKSWLKILRDCRKVELNIILND